MLKRFWKALKENEKGFTMIELIIVIAVIGIIGAVAAPSFIRTSDRARLKADVQSVRAIQGALDLYVAEKGSLPTKYKVSGADADITYGADDVFTATSAQQVITALIDTGYLKATDIKPQSTDAEFRFEKKSRTFKLYLLTTGVANESYDSLSDSDKKIVDRYTTGS